MYPRTGVGMSPMQSISTGGRIDARIYERATERATHARELLQKARIQIGSLQISFARTVRVLTIHSLFAC
jgi:hypothetical protein